MQWKAKICILKDWLLFVIHMSNIYVKGLIICILLSPWRRAPFGRRPCWRRPLRTGRRWARWAWRAAPPPAASPGTGSGNWRLTHAKVFAMFDVQNGKYKTWRRWWLQKLLNKMSPPKIGTLLINCKNPWNRLSLNKCPNFIYRDNFWRLLCMVIVYEVWTLSDITCLPAHRNKSVISPPPLLKQT